MQFKNALVGAVVGGGGRHWRVDRGLFSLRSRSHTAFAIVVAILVGMGVRTCVATKGHVSYARGAMTALLAIVAFVGGKFIVAEIASRQVAKDMVKVVGTPPLNQSDVLMIPMREAEIKRGTIATPRCRCERPNRRRARHIGAVPRGPRGTTPFSTWDFLWLFAAALVAYELGRGSGTALTTASTPDASPTPAPTA